MLVGHIKDTELGEVVRDDDHFLCLVIIVVEHGLPFARLFVMVGGKAAVTHGETYFHGAVQVVYAFQVKVIGCHVGHAVSEIRRWHGVVDAVHGERLLSVDGAA